MQQRALRVVVTITVNLVSGKSEKSSIHGFSTEASHKTKYFKSSLAFKTFLKKILGRVVCLVNGSLFGIDYPASRIMKKKSMQLSSNC